MRRAVPVAARVVAPAQRSWSEALAVYLRYQHAIGYQRLSKLFEDLQGLKISQGALAGLFQRVKPSFDAQVSAILARLRQSRIVCSDETGARVKGRHAWEWVFQDHRVAGSSPARGAN